MKLTQLFFLTYYLSRRKMFLPVPAYILMCFLQCQFKKVKLWNIVRKMSPKFLSNRFTPMIWFHDLFRSFTTAPLTPLWPPFFSWEMLCMTLINFGNCACHSLDVAGHVRDFWWLQVPQMKGKNVTQNNVKYVPSDRLIAKWGWAISFTSSRQRWRVFYQNVGGICKERKRMHRWFLESATRSFFVSRWNKCHEDSIDSTSFLTHPNRRPAKSDLDGLEMISDDNCAVDS